MRGLVSLFLCAVVATVGTNTSSPAVLFFDGHRLASSTGLSPHVGTAHLLRTFRDPTSFVGWG